MTTISRNFKYLASQDEQDDLGMAPITDVQYNVDEGCLYVGVKEVGTEEIGTQVYLSAEAAIQLRDFLIYALKDYAPELCPSNAI